MRADVNGRRTEESVQQFLECLPTSSRQGVTLGVNSAQSVSRLGVETRPAEFCPGTAARGNVEGHLWAPENGFGRNQQALSDRLDVRQGVPSRGRRRRPANGILIVVSIRRAVVDSRL
jgi:hypothetical protein